MLYDIEGMLPLTIDDVLAEGFKFQTISLCSRCNLWIGDNMREWNLSTLKAVLDLIGLTSGSLASFSFRAGFACATKAFAIIRRLARAS